MTKCNSKHRKFRKLRKKPAAPFPKPLSEAITNDCTLTTVADDLVRLSDALIQYFALSADVKAAYFCAPLDERPAAFVVEVLLAPHALDKRAEIYTAVRRLIQHTLTTDGTFDVVVIDQEPSHYVVSKRKRPFFKQVQSSSLLLTTLRTRKISLATH